MIERGMHIRAVVGAALALLVWTSPAICRQSAPDPRLPQSSEPREPATRVERLLLRKSLLVIKETHFIGAVPGLEGAEVRIEALALTDASKRERVYGIRLVRPVARKEGGERSGIIDFDELVSFQEALDHMLRVAAEAKRPDESSEAGATSNTEFAITTRGSVRVSLVQTGRQFTAHLQVSDADEVGAVTFGTGALGRLRALLSDAREKLVALGAR